MKEWFYESENGISTEDVSVYAGQIWCGPAFHLFDMVGSRDISDYHFF
jgi:hypothetical protein